MTIQIEDLKNILQSAGDFGPNSYYALVVEEGERVTAHINVTDHGPLGIAVVSIDGLGFCALEYNVLETVLTLDTVQHVLKNNATYEDLKNSIPEGWHHRDQSLMGALAQEIDLLVKSYRVVGAHNG